MSREPWAVWKRWCSVCGQHFVHVYLASLDRIECKCGAWINTPRLAVLQGGK